MVALTPQGTKRTGRLVERAGVLTFVRKVDSARHMLRLPEPSWAVDEKKLHEARAAGAERVEVHDEQGRVWWTEIRYLLERGERFDRGWGAQIRLPLPLWSFVPAATEVHRQMGLFAEVSP